MQLPLSTLGSIVMITVRNSAPLLIGLCFQASRMNTSAVIGEVNIWESATDKNHIHFYELWEQHEETWYILCKKQSRNNSFNKRKPSIRKPSQALWEGYIVFATRRTTIPNDSSVTSIQIIIVLRQLSHPHKQKTKNINFRSVWQRESLVILSYHETHSSCIQQYTSLQQYHFHSCKHDFVTSKPSSCSLYNLRYFVVFMNFISAVLAYLQFIPVLNGKSD